MNQNLCEGCAAWLIWAGVSNDYAVAPLTYVGLRLKQTFACLVPARLALYFPRPLTKQPRVSILT